MADENKAMIRRGISTVAEVETAINEKAREKYVDAQDAATRETAKNYADERAAMIRTEFEQGDADVLAEAAKALAEAITVLKGGASADYDTFKKLQTKIEAINEAISGTATPDTIDTLNEALAFIREHQGEIESLVNTYVRKEAIANDLTTDDPTQILSAAQGVALKELIDAVTVSLDGYVEKVNGSGLMTDEEREKLSGIEEGANAYELPIASGSVLGGVKVGAGLEIDAEGTLSAPGGSGGGGYVLPKASAATLGGIKVGNNLSIREDGTLDAQAGSGGSGTGTEKLTLPYIEPAYGDDGVSLTNKEAFIEAWGPVMKKYRAAPDSSRLFMEMPSGIGTEMAEVPCQTVLAQDMGEEGQALLLSAYGVICVPSGYGTVPVGISAGASLLFDTSGEVTSVEWPDYAPAVAGNGMMNMVLRKVYINAEDFSKSGEELKTAMQPYIDAIRSNPMAEAVMLDVKNGWVVPVAITRWAGDSDPTGGSKYILQGNLHHAVENEDEKIGGVSSFVAVCDVDASGTIVTASSFSADSDWVTAEAMNTALAGYLPLGGGTLSNGIDIDRSLGIEAGLGVDYGGAYLSTTKNTGQTTLFYLGTDGLTYVDANNNRRTIWHAGNFNPGSKADAPGTILNGNLNDLTYNGLYVVDGIVYNAPITTANCRVLVIATSPYRVTQIAQVYDSDRIFFRRKSDDNWYPWQELWHAGNFDAQNSLKYLGRGTLLGQFGNGAAGHGFTSGDTPIGQHSSSFLRFGMSGYEVEICLGGYSSWNNGWNRIYFRSKDGDSGSVSDWREFYHTGNLAPATAAAAGLMSAEDRIKLNSVASALSLPVVTEDMPTTLEMEAEDAARVMAVTPQACIRAQRAAQYQMQTDELLYDALEAFARNHPEYSEFAAWLEAKDRIRQEFPKPGATEVADSPETDGEPLTGGTESAAEQKGGEE
ncbi:pyocin knob domain-containing protein [Rikenella microfusus]|uniref:pyocin knob domain-containing protein n=1 Tax=Rikenella microfusus TaxID=28139 RepID=UPI00248EBC73|nr:pyocin knob domain-containing protein [Rikenella microfusus]